MQVAPDHAPASEETTASVERGHADQGGDGLVQQGPKVRQLGEQGPRDDRADARRSPQAALLGPPDGGCADGLGQVRVYARNPALQPAIVCLEVFAQAGRGAAELVPFGRSACPRAAGDA